MLTSTSLYMSCTRNSNIFKERVDTSTCSWSYLWIHNRVCTQRSEKQSTWTVPNQYNADRRGSWEFHLTRYLQISTSVSRFSKDHSWIRSSERSRSELLASQDGNSSGTDVQIKFIEIKSDHRHVPPSRELKRTRQNKHPSVLSASVFKSKAGSSTG